ncbi:MAG: EAL domain-containing protein [Burkholderiales bacterium]|nr:EAL domain-containing protein [Burkholderiales bacterium]
MSLFRQLWLAVISLTMVIFIGSFLVSVLTARAYLEQQLSIKNVDNASALALSLSQLPEKDPIAIELLVSAQFDSGHYQEIRLTDPTHRVVVERKYVGDTLGAPAWFARIFPIRATQGIAQVQDGWRQLGTLTVTSHSRYAYSELWSGALKLLSWLLAAGFIAGVIGTLIMRIIVRPLDQVVGQAQAISERRFITLNEPRTPELNSVVRAMNQMVARLKQMFEEEAERLDHLRREINHDAVTGLPNRDAFMNYLQTALVREDAAPLGALLIVRLKDLGEINRRLGHGSVDLLLKQVASILTEHCARRHEHIAARLNGADFALLAPNENEIAKLTQAIVALLHQQLSSDVPAMEDHFHVGAILYRRGDETTALLAAADQALATAEGKGPNGWHATVEGEAPVARSTDAWRNLLTTAITEKRLKLAFFPVRTAAGQTLHQESVIRLQTTQEGSWLVAGDFIPMATRLKLSSTLDFEVIRLALDTLQSAPGDIAVHLSTDSIADWGFHKRLSALLNQQPDLCKRLWIEVSEYGVLRQPEAFREIAHTLKAMQCRVGIEHAGHRLSDLAQLADLGLDYLKVDSSLVRAVDQNMGNQALLKGLCKMAHTLGITMIAEGVQTEAELALLPQLGFDATTGPAVSK